jgi:hypothetical protein
VALAWLGAVRYMERLIGALPAQFHYLQYANWMAMFLLPGLAWRWYSRYSERKADRKVAILDDPKGAISGYYKLYLLNELPLDRPWWSRVLSTHPTLAEEIETIARRSGLTAEQVDEAKRRAEAEVESGSGDRYDMAFHEEPEAEIEKRGSRAFDTIVFVGVLIVACVLLFGSFFWMVDKHLESWAIVAVLIGGAAAIALVVILPIELYRRWVNNRLRRRIRCNLAARYGAESVSSMLLVDTHLIEDEKRWQGALIGIQDGKVVILAESREVGIPLDGKVEVVRWTNSNTSFGDNARMVVIRYEVESVPQRAVIRNLGTPEKGLPRSHKELERHVRELVTGAGGTIRKQGTVPVRQMLIRAPVALLILAAAIGLVELLLRLADILDNYFVHGIVLASVGSMLYAWVTKRPDSKQTDLALDEDGSDPRRY